MALKPTINNDAIAGSYVFRYQRGCPMTTKKQALVHKVLGAVVDEIVNDLFQGGSVFTRLRAARRLGNRRLFGGRPLSPLGYVEPAKHAVAALEMAAHIDDSPFVRREAQRSLSNLFLARAS